MVFKLGMTVDVCVACTLVLKSLNLTLTLMQDQSGLAEEKSPLNYLDNHDLTILFEVLFLLEL